MHCGTRFTSNQIRKILSDEGYEPGTKEYQKEFSWRYLPSGEGYWVENPNWNPMLERSNSDLRYDVV